MQLPLDDRCVSDDHPIEVQDDVPPADRVGPVLVEESLLRIVPEGDVHERTDAR